MDGKSWQFSQFFFVFGKPPFCVWTCYLFCLQNSENSYTTLKYCLTGSLQSLDTTCFNQVGFLLLATVTVFHNNDGWPVYNVSSTALRTLIILTNLILQQPIL